MPDLPNQTSPGQAPDASDSARDQVPNVPDENIKAPVKRATEKPDIPEENRQDAQAAKDELLEGDQEKRNEG